MSRRAGAVVLRREDDERVICERCVLADTLPRRLRGLLGHRALVAGEVLKWLWIGVALGAALGLTHLPALPLVTGMLAAQFGFWLGLALIKR